MYIVNDTLKACVVCLVCVCVCVGVWVWYMYGIYMYSKRKIVGVGLTLVAMKSLASVPAFYFSLTAREQ